jgi:hypothetical protein
MFFDAFPRIQYDIVRARYSNYETVTDIFFRISIIKDILNNISTYYNYEIRDGDTPEILADKLYSNPEAYWIITYANDIYDRNYDWPLDYRSFEKYIINKYGSVAAAQSGTHHYEKVIQRTESLSDITTETRIKVDFDKKSDVAPDVPYDYYENLPETQSVEVINLGNGQTVTEVISRNAVSNYDYEVAENDKKRIIKIIKSDYYKAIMDEFNNFTENRANPFLRTVA